VQMEYQERLEPGAGVEPATYRLRTVPIHVLRVPKAI